MSQLRRTLCALASALAALPAAALAAPEAPHHELKVVASVPGPDGGWDYASFDAARHRIYISHGDGGAGELDVETNTLNDHFSTGDHLHAIVPVPGSPGSWSPPTAATTTVRIIPRLGRRPLVKSLTVAADADGAAYDPKTRLVVVVNGDPGLLTLIDVAGRKVVGTITVRRPSRIPGGRRARPGLCQRRQHRRGGGRRPGQSQGPDALSDERLPAADGYRLCRRRSAGVGLPRGRGDQDARRGQRSRAGRFQDRRLCRCGHLRSGAAAWPWCRPRSTYKLNIIARCPATPARPRWCRFPPRSGLGSEPSIRNARGRVYLPTAEYNPTVPRAAALD